MRATHSEASLRRLLPHMQHVAENRETLKSLEAVWDVLNLLGQLSGTTTEMADTKAAFASLTERLLHNLARTTFDKRVQELAAPAQVAIDILVRNLFERTADIGFLALDDTLRAYAAACVRGHTPDSAAMAQRLQAYVAKYSVYRDVILVAPDGRVLARLPGAPPVATMGDPLLAEVLASGAAYTEAAVRSDLFPGESRNLLYGVRVLDERGQVLGALFLCFDFGNEMERIFGGLRRDGDWSVITLLDDADMVIASSDPYQIAPGTVVHAPEGDGRLLRFGGTSWLVARHRAREFQGYPGPAGWTALVMVPLAMAFDESFDDDETAQPPADATLVRAVLRAGTGFARDLQAIPQQADAIQRELNRSVWNANVRQGRAAQAASNPAFSKVLLAEIVRTGTRMKEVFTRSIGELQTMAVGSQLADCRFLSALAMDILDRNLYERANDCRWWALDPLLRALLHDRAAESRAARMADRLAAINDLYTVYDSLVLFDAHGTVQATSRPALAEWIGRTLEGPWVARTLAAKGADDYSVSEFAPQPLYGDRPTWIYAAALRDDHGAVTGGIAIVFDAAAQLTAMLQAALPRRDGAFALFIDAANNVIAATDPQRAAGKVDVPADLHAAAQEGAARLVLLDGQVLAVGAQASLGYREYAGTAGQAGQRALALVCVPLGAADGTDVAEETESAPPPAVKADGPTLDVATFRVGGYLLGVPAAAVVEAIPFGGHVRLPNASPALCGATVYEGGTMLIYDLHLALGVEARQPREQMLTVVLQGDDGRRFGVLVDRLGAIPAVREADIAPISNVFVGMTPVLASVVRSSAGDDGPMLTLLAVAHMAQVLGAVKCDAVPLGLLE